MPVRTANCACANCIWSHHLSHSGHFCARAAVLFVMSDSPVNTHGARCCHLLRLEFCHYSRLCLAHHDKRAFAYTPVSLFSIKYHLVSLYPGDFVCPNLGPEFIAIYKPICIVLYAYGEGTAVVTKHERIDLLNNTILGSNY